MRSLRLRRRAQRNQPAHAVAVPDEPTITPDEGERELASRIAAGLHIALFWNPRDDRLAVAVADRRNGHALRFPIDAARALDAFHHPFAYAP
jgi:hypothetical protein